MIGEVRVSYIENIDHLKNKKIRNYNQSVQITIINQPVTLLLQTIPEFKSFIPNLV